MKINYVVPVLLSVALFSSNAMAEKVNAEFYGTVQYIWDPSGVVPELSVGEMVAGSYVFDTATPDQDPIIGIGNYAHAPMPSAMVVNFSGNSFTIDDGGLNVYINDEAWMPNDEGYSVSIWSPTAAMSGIAIEFVSLDMWGYQGGALDSELLVSQVPDPNKFDMFKRVYVSGVKDGNYFYFEASVDALSSAGAVVMPESFNAKPYTFKVLAQVDYMYDTMGELFGKISQGETIEVIYTVDANVPGVTGFIPEETIYDHPKGVGEIEIVGNGWSSSIDKISARTLFDYAMNFSGFSLHGDWATPFMNQNINVEWVDVWFGPSYDPYRNSLVLNSSAMPLDVDLLKQFDMSTVNIFGAGGSWHVSARVVSIELISGPGVKIYPADGRVHPMQRFDAAIYVQQLPEVSYLSGMLNGMDVSYMLQSCMIMPAQEAEQTVICPDIHRFLMPGDNQLSIDVNLMNQTVEKAEVIWSVK